MMSNTCFGGRRPAAMRRRIKVIPSDVPFSRLGACCLVGRGARGGGERGWADLPDTSLLVPTPGMSLGSAPPSSTQPTPAPASVVPVSWTVRCHSLITCQNTCSMPWSRHVTHSSPAALSGPGSRHVTHVTMATLSSHCAWPCSPAHHASRLCLSQSDHPPSLPS